MRSLRTKLTLMTLLIVVIAVVIVTLTSVIFIRSNETRKSDQLMLLLCETGVRNLNYYFNSVQKSVEKVASFAEADLNGLEGEDLEDHINHVEEYFNIMASKTNGVLTYYYRIDPEVSDTVKGFWFTDIDGEGFVEHEVTDITKYDTMDTSKLVWFTVPKHNGEAIWLPPYITDNLDMRVISYNVPIYREREFVGVVGIEIDYSMMAEQVDSIHLYESGYAFLNDDKGNLFYHPRIDIAQLTEETTPVAPKGVLDEDTFIQYEFEGEEKEAAWLPLSNGMRLNVCAPVAETEGEWQLLILDILFVAAVALIISSLITMLYTKRISRPLKQLIEAAEQADKGNYDYSLEYDNDDEVGKLTKTFKRLSGHMKEHINDLNKQVFIDALTRVKNKGAFSAMTDELQEQLISDKTSLEFAVGVFDCDNLKLVNDKYGHDKGDIYLKSASRSICNIFQHSPVFRIGGDEFAVILKNDDYNNRDALVEQFEKNNAEINSSTDNIWEQVHIAVGIAVCDPQNDPYVSDVVRRADKLMYENKRLRKIERSSL
ncbi:MAG: diguanylate cyclase [Clostridia bacterium]|nr:diguanylate cyclase [Clostridia bacterium]